MSHVFGVTCSGGTIMAVSQMRWRHMWYGMSILRLAPFLKGGHETTVASSMVCSARGRVELSLPGRVELSLPGRIELSLPSSFSLSTFLVSINSMNSCFPGNKSQSYSVQSLSDTKRQYRCKSGLLKYR